VWRWEINRLGRLWRLIGHRSPERATDADRRVGWPLGAGL